MARSFSREQVGVLDGLAKPPLLADGQLIHAKVRRVRATINLADKAYVVGDDVVLGKRPSNTYYVGHTITSSVSLGATTIALGAVGNPTKYRAAATFTTPDVPTDISLTAQLAADKLVVDELQLVTFAAANAPAAGLLIIEFFYTND